MRSRRADVPAVPQTGSLAPAPAPGAAETAAPAEPVQFSRADGYEAPAADAVAAVKLPAGVKQVRLAGPRDAEAIAAIQGQYQLRNIDVADHPSNGWLVQKSAPEAIRFAMNRWKDFWVAEGHDGKVIGFQAVSAPRFISRPAAKHHFFGPQGPRAAQIVREARFIYMSQIAVAPEWRGKGLTQALQREALLHNRHLPLAAHVAVATQADFDAWDKDPAHFAPHSDNTASHRYHQRQGYVPVAWTSDLSGTREFNSGLPPDPEGIAGILYLNFRDGQGVEEFVEPSRAFLENPDVTRDPHDVGWENPFPPSWPEPEVDLSGTWDMGFLPSYQGQWDWYDGKLRDEMNAIRR